MMAPIATASTPTAWATIGPGEAFPIEPGAITPAKPFCEKTSGHAPATTATPASTHTTVTGSSLRRRTPSTINAPPITAANAQASSSAIEIRIILAMNHRAALIAFEMAFDTSLSEHADSNATGATAATRTTTERLVMLTMSTKRSVRLSPTGRAAPRIDAPRHRERIFVNNLNGEASS